MLPAVFPLLSAAGPVTAIIGTNPVRAYKHGQAPQNVIAPYVTYASISTVPQNALDEAPRVDAFSMQVDCWSVNTGTGSAGIETLAKAVRNAIEPVAHMVSGPTDSFDAETGRYRITMTFDFWTHR